MSLIEKLTPEQEALIPVYRQKWRAIALSTERIDREKAAEVVKAAYVFVGLSEPEILFFDSPYAAWAAINGDLESKLEYKLYQGLWKLIFGLREIYQQLHIEIINKLSAEFSSDAHILLRQDSLYLGIPLINELDDTEQDVASLIDCCISPTKILLNGIDKDFCISVLNCTHNSRKWNLFQAIIKDCGWIFTFENICIVCDRPLHLRFDNQNRLHAEGEPAIEFTDGYSLYSYHGVTLPEKYGKIHPQQWQAEWLLSEENAELRRVLIQSIGYARICQQLQAIELDNWQEYTLLKIDNNVDIEPIYLLKMTCPSTGFIHALRVPPNMNSAREAICWVNWGIEPEEFAIQT